MINIYQINNTKFKSIYFSLNFTMPVNEKENSENAVLASILNKSSEKYKSQKEIEKFLYNAYGANYDTVVEKYGDLYNIEFRMECINKRYLPNHVDVVTDCLKFLYSMIFEPYLVDSKFEETIVEREKQFILNRIKERKDDKLQYAVSKTEELLCYPDPFGMYVYGKEELVASVTPGDLYKRYLNILNCSCITLIVSGNLDGYEQIEETIKQVFQDKIESQLGYDQLIFNVHSQNNIREEIQELSEIQDTNQSVVTFGLKIKDPNPQKDFYVMNLYNAILGTTPSSKLFQNVREKESLAYTVRSRYYRYKSMMIIYAGIEKKNYNRTKEVVLEQLNQMEKGEISDEEFHSSKESLIADLLEWNDSKIALSKMLLANMIVNHHTNLTIEKMIEQLNQVTKQDVIEVAKRIELEQIFLLGGEADV